MATSIHVKANCAWETVDIPQDLLNSDDFSGLVDIQVLNDYELVQSEVQEDDDVAKSKKKKRKRGSNAEDLESPKKLKTTSGEPLSSKPAKKKRKKEIQEESQSEQKLHLANKVAGGNVPEHSRKNKKRKTEKEQPNRQMKSGKLISGENIETVSDDLQPGNSKERSNPGAERKKKQKKKGQASKMKTVTCSNSDCEENVKEADIATAITKDMTQWDNLHVPDVILRALQNQNFDKPTEIQRLALPSAIRDRKDILGAAETGSGKTLAFGIPVLAKMLQENGKAKRHQQEKSTIVTQSSDDGEEDMEDDADEDSQSDTTKPNHLHQCDHPMALILEPTRELAMQVKNHLISVASCTDIKFAAVVGGMSIEKQRRVLSKRPHVIIATPGRLWQLIEEGNEYLSKVDQVFCLVVDEADRMVEKGHFEELTKIMELLNKSERHRKNRQTFVMSATLTMEVAAPKRLLNKAKKKVKQEDKLKTLTDRICLGLKPKVIDLTPKDKVAQTLTELRVNCKAEEKDMYLYYFLCEHQGRTLVFVNSKDCLRRLVSVFTLLQCQPLPLHADMHQRQRLKNLDRFTERSKSLLLASDVAARGLDIPKVDYVIHYQVPRTMENYVHRSGRTGRASNLGLSVMLVGPEEARDYRKIIQGVKNGEDLPLLPVNMDLIPAAKQRVELAKTVDVTEHRVKKDKARNNFFLRAAEEMDMIIDDKNLLADLGDSDEQNQGKRQLKQMKAELAAMLKGSLAPARMTKYPTKSGQLVKKKMVNLYEVGS